MRYIWNIFLLLVVVEKTFAGDKKCGDNKCANNKYKHDPALFPELKGYLYTLYSSVAYSNNEVSKFDHKGNDRIFVRSTTDGECCRSLNITFGEEYNVYNTVNDADCSMKDTEDSGHNKLIVSNTGCDGSFCIVLWSCRKSREGVYALCDKRMISHDQSEWICKQYDRMGLKAHELEPTADYKGGKCFKN